MHNQGDIQAERLSHAWQELQELDEQGIALPPKAYRLAFADPEFLLRPETRSLRLQMEMLKPELALDQHQIDHTIVVYGSARTPSPEKAEALFRDNPNLPDRARIERQVAYYQAAREFSKLVATFSKDKPRDKHLYICTGGGPGIMEAANRGAAEAGEPSIGLNITLPHEQHCNPWISPDLCFKFHYFAIRKMHFLFRAAALVVFPGGFGTLDELFEVITLVQTHKTSPVPIVMFGTEYWKRVLNLDVLVEEGMIAAEDLRMLTYVDTPQAAWETVLQFYHHKTAADRTRTKPPFTL